MIFTKNEKGAALNYQETDNNFLSLRNTIAIILQQTNDTSTLNTSVNKLVQDVETLKTGSLKDINNLSDLNSLAISRNNLEVASKIEADNKYLDIANNLTNIQDVNTVLQNLGIGNNALRDVNFTSTGNPPDATEGQNGDIWYDYAIIVSGGV